MALHVRVWNEGQGFIGIRGEWEDGKQFELETIEQISGLTTAEQVEFHMLEHHNLVASWMWTWGETLGRNRQLHGQFVHAAGPGHKASKEVSDSIAHKFDL